MRELIVFVVFAGCGFRVATPGTADPDGGMADPDATDTGSDAASLTCPTTPAWKTVAGQTSSYRLEPALVTWYVARQSCETGAGFHLAIYETQAETMDVRSLYTSGQIYWIGMFQPAGQSTTLEGWRWITGGAGLPNWEPSEPNDADLIENSVEQFAVALLPQGKFRDTDGPMPHSYICECDGKPLDGPTIALIP